MTRRAPPVPSSHLPAVMYCLPSLDIPIDKHRSWRLMALERFKKPSNEARWSELELAEIRTQLKLEDPYYVRLQKDHVPRPNL